MNDSFTLRKELTAAQMIVFYWSHQMATGLLLEMWGFDSKRPVTVHEDPENNLYIVEQTIEPRVRGLRANHIVLDENVHDHNGKGEEHGSAK